MAVNCLTPFIPIFDIVKVPPYTEIQSVDYLPSHSNFHANLIFLRHQFSFQGFVPKHFHVRANLFQALCISIHYNRCDEPLLCVHCYANIDFVMPNKNQQS